MAGSGKHQEFSANGCRLSSGFYGVEFGNLTQVSVMRLEMSVAYFVTACDTECREGLGLITP